MKKRRITTLKSLRKQKMALALEIEQQQADIIQDAEALVWPFRVFRKYRESAENIAENKFFSLGVQLAQSILSTAWQRKKENEEHASHGFVDFMKNVADDFLRNYSKAKTQQEQE